MGLLLFCYVYSFILGGSSDSLIFKKLRQDNSLCYYANSSYILLYQMLEMNVGIQSENYDKAVELIKEALDELREGNFDEEEIKKKYSKLNKNEAKTYLTIEIDTKRIDIENDISYKELLSDRNRLYKKLAVRNAIILGVLILLVILLKWFDIYLWQLHRLCKVQRTRHTHP